MSGAFEDKLSHMAYGPHFADTQTNGAKEIELIQAGPKKVGRIWQ
jgi:hypothetical protein